MSRPALALLPGAIARPLLAVLLTASALVALPPLPAHAFENRAFGSVVVHPGETEPEVSTAVGDVKVEGVVDGDVNSGFGDIEVRGEVGDGINAGRGDVEVYGPVGGGIEAGFGDVYVDAPVGGDIDVGRGDLVLGPGALVDGDVRSGSGEVRGNKDAVEGALVAGRAPHMEYEGFGLLGGFEGGWIFAAAAFVACSVLLAVLAPRPLVAAARRAEQSPGWSLLIGIASAPAASVLAVVLAVSIVGIPLLLLLAPACLALLFFGALVAAYFVGRRIVFATGRYRGGNALAAAVGALLLSVVYAIPVLGALLAWGLILFGVGASILALFSRRRPPAYPSYEAYVQDRRDA